MTQADNDITFWPYLDVCNISVAAVIKEKLHKVAFNQTFFIIYLISNPQLIVI